MALREEKKRATRIALADTAMMLFAERGFDRVTVAEVARAANVSVNTAFNYFPTKEDLFFDRQEEAVDRLARAVREREVGESPAAAIHRMFLDEVRREDPTLGLSTDAVHFWRMIDASPALQARLRRIVEESEDALTDALRASMEATAEDPMPRLAAAVLTGIDRALHAEIRRGILAGEQPAVVRTRIVAAAARGFGAVTTGFTDQR
ncbi:TetR/AcrR family transcriptional regulator [Nocardia sp. 2]|uniref:TetR/AcrR family transcriptional regulator n=1 Tax=Nocardia acididurans TaxID=2802282 RepID=A0ABS1M348_9NOCA|nr:TetR/AcrR family transcriptional regulator [Nocardia acididurans]MBL1074605.1 TetR/AcrR family transcriptional regulator [Nocardia acididurans]